jgi:hypothetical protein
MSDTGFASLSPALLARKGGAKPAMRPQNTGGVTDGKAAAANLEDLGWNDMGDDDQAQSARVVRITSAGSDSTSVAAAPSPVRATIDRIAAKLEAPHSVMAPMRPGSLKKAANDSRRAMPRPARCSGPPTSRLGALPRPRPRSMTRSSSATRRAARS